jgi:hypothetical protein
MKLNGNDKKILETLFEMRGGYVLDFSDRRMKDFFYEEFEIDIYDAKYDLDYPSKSKANRLRAIWLVEDEKTVGKIILSLVEYLETTLLVNAKEVPSHTKDLILKARQIGTKLEFPDFTKDYEPFIKMITDKTAIIKNFISSDFSDLKTNQKIYLLKVLYSYYEAILRAYYGNGLFFLTSGIDNLNDYFKILRKRLIELLNSDDTFSEIRKNKAYEQLLEPVTSLYSSTEFFDGIWEDHTYPLLLNLREEIADKDLFENNSEIHQVGMAIPIFLEAISKEINVLKGFMEEKTKRFYEEDLPKQKEQVNPSSKKEEVIKHEHIHRFENSIQEKDIVLNHKYDETKHTSQYLTKRGDDFYYKGLHILSSKKNTDYYKVLSALYAKLPNGGEISYKELSIEIRSRMPELKNKTNDEMIKFIQRNLTDKANGFLRYAEIPETEDNGKPLVAVSRSVGIVFNNTTG